MGERYYTIGEWCELLGIERGRIWKGEQGRKAKALCKQRGLDCKASDDSHTGYAGTYPESVLKSLIWHL